MRHKFSTGIKQCGLYVSAVVRSTKFLEPIHLCFRVWEIYFPGHYIDFDEAWEREDARTETALPEIVSNKVKHPFKLILNRARDFLKCTECRKDRVIWSPIGPKKCVTLLPYIDSLKTSGLYSCGTVLPDNEPKCYINGNLTCEDLMENIYYKLSVEPLCCVCASALDKKRVELYEENTQKFSVVKPTCGSPDCGPFRTSRPRKVPQKRQRKKSTAKPKKRQRLSPWDMGSKKETEE